jgi:hypothetical protein
MVQLPLVTTAVTHQLYDSMLGVTGRRGDIDGPSDRDRGAVSLEQVMWFVAAGVAVAVIATILFQRIRDEANDSPINTISPPEGVTP